VFQRRKEAVTKAMTRSLQLVHRDGNKPAITTKDLIEGFFSPQQQERIEANVLRCREEFKTRAYIGTHDDFTAESFRWYAHVHDWFSETKSDPARINPAVAISTLQRWYGKPWHEAERNALYLRDGGGFIGIINAITETLVKEHLEAYFDAVLYDYIPADQDARIRLAEEFVERYADVLYTGPDVKQAPMLAANIEHHLKVFAKARRQLGNALMRF
jgi:hypothetical protein